MERVMVAIDGSDHGVTAVQATMDMAQQCGIKDLATLQW